VDMINLELVVEHDRHRILRHALLPWRRYAHEKEVARRNEEIVRENKIRFDRRMEEAEGAAQELMRLEREREQRALQQAEEARKLDRVRRLEEAKGRAAQSKEEEKKFVLSVQKEERARRVNKELRKMRRAFKKEWVGKTEAMLAKARSRITSYIENKENALAIEMKFELLKREFFQPPTPENAAREKLLSSLKNIVFLYVQAKLRADMIKMADLMPRYDKGKKGYLTYGELKELINSIGADINPAKISAIIRGVDADGDKCIELKELEASMKETDCMGVMGSAWRWYIDPAESVMTYHNFVTGERIFDYKMTDKKLREINLENMYGEADHLALQEVQLAKDEEWDLLVKNHMASRLQFMYRRRKANQWRQKKMLKLTNQVLKAKTDTHRRCVRFLERSWEGYLSRMRFRKQLRYTFEKIWDVDSAKLFWYNCVTGASTWDRPYLLGRYEDVSDPSEWVSNPVVASDEDRAAGRRIYSGADLAETSFDGVQFDKSQSYVVHYWHVKARKSIPRKPDGLPLCSHCQRNIAVHRCDACAVDFCLSCHRGTHGNPFGVHQHAKANKDQFLDPGIYLAPTRVLLQSFCALLVESCELSIFPHPFQFLFAQHFFLTAFLQQLSFHAHPFSLSKSKRCQMCHSSKFCAGIHCDTCDSDMCRECSRRYCSRHCCHSLCVFYYYYRFFLNLSQSTRSLFKDKTCLLCHMTAFH
jgi:hypothetical protein